MNLTEFRAKADHDARFVLLVSLVALVCSLGLFFMAILARIFQQAITTPCSGFNPASLSLVVGKKLIADRPGPEYIARLDRLLACEFSNAILLGGKTPGSGISEADAGVRYLRKQTDQLPKIHLEQQSQSTLENLRNARELIGERATVIISNRYHLTRCSILAQNFRIKHDLCAAESNFRPYPDILVKCLCEAFYIHWFYAGKIWAMATRNKRMLNKIT